MDSEERRFKRREAERRAARSCERYVRLQMEHACVKEVFAGYREAASAIRKMDELRKRRF